MFIKSLAKIKKPTKPLIIIGVIVLVGIFFLINVTNAGLFDIAEKTVLKIIGWIASLIISLLGALLGLVIDILVAIASYNEFTSPSAPPAIHIGWGVVRDFSNLLFVIGLMIIAFGTILKIQTYHARNALVKLIIMAVLINFSKTITGVLIDFAQVVMMTFVDAFSSSAPIVLTISLNLKQMLDLANSADASLTNFGAVIMSMIFAIVLLIVAIAVVFAMSVLLLFRILMLWVLIILSPIAYIATVLPNTQRYASAWWSSLGKNLISGPLLAFFLWLSLSIISTSGAQPVSLQSPSAEIPMGASEIMTTQNVFNYVITIALLIMGLMMTQSLGVMGGSFAGSMVGKLRTAGIGAITKPIKAAGKSYAWAARKIKAGGLPGGFMKGIDINPANIVRTMRAGFARKRAQEERVGMVKAGERLEKGGFKGALFGLGAASWVDNYAQGFLFRKGIQKAAPFVAKGRAAKITDMYAEEDRRKKAIEDLEQKAEAKNPTEMYSSLRDEELRKTRGDLRSKDSEIESLEGARNLFQEAGSNEIEAETMVRDLESGKIPITEATATRTRAEQLRKDATVKREQALKAGYDPKTSEQRLKELREERDIFYDNKVRPIEEEINNYNSIKNYNEKNTFAKEKLEDMANRKRELKEALLKGGLTEAQKRMRAEGVKELDLKIKNLNIDIEDKRSLGKDTSAQERRLQQLEDEKKDKLKYTATPEEIKENKEEIKKLENEERELIGAAERAEKGEIITEDQREVLRKQAEQAKKELQAFSDELQKEAAYRPIDFLAQQERRRSAEEESRKYVTTNEDELIAYQENALKRGNVTDAAAVALQAARVGHLNELINVVRATEDWYEDPETGEITTEKKPGARIVFKKDDFLSAGIEGLHVYMKEIFEKKFKYGKQTTLALENDLSNIAETINHWTLGQAIGSRPDGQFRQRPRSEQQARCYVERSKRDFENLYRQGNRLSIGTERWQDPADHSKGRMATLNEYAVLELMNKWEKLESLATRGRFNASASEHIMQFNKNIIDLIERKAIAAGKAKDWVKFRGDLETLGGKAGEIKNIRTEIQQAREILKDLGLFK